jgi:hypothetical protein
MHCTKYALLRCAITYALRDEINFTIIPPSFVLCVASVRTVQLCMEVLWIEGEGRKPYFGCIDAASHSHSC